MSGAKAVWRELGSGARHVKLSASIALLAILLTSLPAQAITQPLLTPGYVSVAAMEVNPDGGVTPSKLPGGPRRQSQLESTNDCTYIKSEAVSSCAASLGIGNRLELTYDTRNFDGMVAEHSIKQDSIGAKVRLTGDAVSDSWLPQVSFGTEFKRSLDHYFFPKAIGTRSSTVVDFYISATKVFLAGPLGRTWMVDLTARETRADKFSIQGYGGSRGTSYAFEPEADVVLFLADPLVAGVEYRPKANRVQMFAEQSAKDVFLGYYPTKNLSVTAAYVAMGNVAIHPGMHVWYLGLQATF